MFGVRRNGGLAGVLAGILGPRLGEPSGGGSACAVTATWTEFAIRSEVRDGTRWKRADSSTFFNGLGLKAANAAAILRRDHSPDRLETQRHQSATPAQSAGSGPVPPPVPAPLASGPSATLRTAGSGAVQRHSVARSRTVPV